MGMILVIVIAVIILKRHCHKEYQLVCSDQ